MRAILINPYDRTVTEITVNPGLDSIGGMYSVLYRADPAFSGMVECVGLSTTPPVDLWLDEEGCLEAGRPVWQFGDGNGPHYAGACLLLCNDGEGDMTSLPPYITREAMARLIHWTNLETTGDFLPSREYETDHPIFGKTMVLEGGKPIYRERLPE